MCREEGVGAESAAIWAESAEGWAASAEVQTGSPLRGRCMPQVAKREMIAT